MSTSVELEQLCRDGLRCRLIQRADNSSVAGLIVNTLTEFGCIGPGYASGDDEVKIMYETYAGPMADYWVLEELSTGRVVGGGGYSRLKGTTETESICEVQKLYFEPHIRGRGFGTQLLAYIVQQATQAGFAKAYLETVTQMKGAQALYARLGFESITEHLGATGHHQRCTVRMVKEL
jgi:putative acetyltransferase